MTTGQEEHLKRNFTLGVLNGMLVNFGLAFIDPFTVLPVFITRLGGSSVMIGLATAVYSAGWFLPQVFVSRIVQTRQYVLSIYSAMAILRAAAYAGAVAVVFLVDPSMTRWMVAGLIACLAVNTVCAGIAGVPFLEVASKSIPVAGRGMFFGTRRLLGGFLGIFAGVIVAIVLGEDSNAFWAHGPLYAAAKQFAARWGITGWEFPRDYGVLFIMGGVAASIGWIAFAFMKEEPAQTVREARSLQAHLREGVSILRTDANYRLFFLVRICWQFTSMAFPFYAAYAFSILGFSEATVGIFVSLWVGSGVVSNYVWGKLADVRGNRIVLVLTAGISVLAPVAILVLSAMGASATDASGAVRLDVFLLVAAALVVSGFARSGRFISNMTYMLEFAPETRRPLYVGFMNSISFPFMLSPVLAGWLAQVTSFELLFFVSGLFGLLNTYLSYRLIEPRRPVSVATAVELP